MSQFVYNNADTIGYVVEMLLIAVTTYWVMRLLGFRKRGLKAHCVAGTVGNAIAVAIVG